MQHLEPGNPKKLNPNNPFLKQHLHTYDKMLSLVMQYSGFPNCGKSILFDEDFGSFPNGSYAKVVMLYIILKKYLHNLHRF